MTNYKFTQFFQAVSDGSDTYTNIHWMVKENKVLREKFWSGGQMQ
jgi:hypothetical protein